MADFKITFPLTLGNEGYYVSQEFWRAHGDNVSGETYMGIDRIQNSAWQGWSVIDAYKANNGTPAWNFRFPQELGLETMVMQFVKGNYWDRMKGDLIINQALANLIFDMEYMSGGWGIEQMQKSINQLIAPAIIGVDGQIGNQTLGYINSLPAAQLYATVYNTRRTWYVQERLKGNVNANAWLVRLSKYPAMIEV